MNLENIFQNKNELCFIIVIVIIFIWYYVEIYKQGLTLSSYFYGTTTVKGIHVQDKNPAHFKNDIKNYIGTPTEKNETKETFEEDNLKSFL